jgi:hypothetical protein
MDGYPTHAVAHNLPFVILFGLGSAPSKPLEDIEAHYPLLQEKGIYISSDLPNVTGPAAEELSKCFYDFDAGDAAWSNRQGKGKHRSLGFTYRSVGRVGQTRLPSLYLPLTLLFYIYFIYFSVGSLKVLPSSVHKPQCSSMRPLTGTRP